MWVMIAYAVVAIHISIVSVTVYLHRDQAHRSIECSKPLAHFFRFWLFLTTGTVTKAWAAIHRKHHARCETVEDPHSPQVLGIKKVLLEGAELYRGAACDKEMLERYGHGTPDDWLERKLYTPYSFIGIYFTLAINTILFGVPGIMIWAMQMAWMPLLAAGVINGLGHYLGYRNFESPDVSKNIVPWGILIGGEELHNNHHSYPVSAKFSNKWWEFDLGWMYIKLFSYLRLVKIKRVAPSSTMVAAIKIEAQAAQAIVQNKIDVMARYYKNVLLPTLKARKQYIVAYDSLKLAMRRDDRYLPNTLIELREATISKFKDIALVHQMRCALQDIWEAKNATHEQVSQALEHWCREAQDSGNAALAKFAQGLRGYKIITSR